MKDDADIGKQTEDCKVEIGGARLLYGGQHCHVVIFHVCEGALTSCVGDLHGRDCVILW